MANPFPFTAGQVLTAAQMNGIGERTAFTPTVSSVTGAIFVAGALDCSYMRVQKAVIVEFDITITSIGTAGGAILFTLPINANSSLMGTGVGRESGVTAAPLFIWHTTTQAQIQKFDGTFIGGNGYRYVGTITYGVA
jgi:hypothetical protein